MSSAPVKDVSFESIYKNNPDKLHSVGSMSLKPTRPPPQNPVMERAIKDNFSNDNVEVKEDVDVQGNKTVVYCLSCFNKT